MGANDEADDEADDVRTLTDEDRNYIDLARRTARKLLTHRRATPRVIAGIGFALHALNNFPHVDEGLSVEFSVCYRHNRETRHVDFRVSDCVFEISSGGTADSGFGSDSSSEPGYRIEANGDVEWGCELWQIEDLVSELLNLGADISVAVEGGNFEEVKWEDDQE